MDSVASWADPANNPNASDYFYAPYVDGSSNCVLYRSADNGATWDGSSPTVNGCIGVGDLFEIAGGGATMVSVGQDNGTPIVIQSTDDGANWSLVSLPSGGSGAIRELVVF